MVSSWLNSNKNNIPIAISGARACGYGALLVLGKAIMHLIASLIERMYLISPRINGGTGIMENKSS